MEAHILPQSSAEQRTGTRVKFLFGLIALALIPISAFLYEWLTSTNPIVYGNVVIWYGYFIGTAYFTFILGGIFFKNNKGCQFLLTVIVVFAILYCVWCIHCSFFFQSMVVQLQGETHFFPVIEWDNIWRMMTDFDLLKSTTQFVVENESLNLSYKGHKGGDTGSTFLNIVRVIEVIPFFFFSIRAIYKPSYNEHNN